MKIVPAELKDVNQLNTISVASKMHWGYPIDWLEHWKDDLTITENYLTKNSIFKLIIEKEIAGFCAIEEREDEYEIAHLWVLPIHIGKGYGKFLLSETLKHVIKKEKPIIVVADPNAEKSYQQMGFKTFAQKESYPKGRFLPVMRKLG
jgi:N-acetylglutamate synthase-like GNAT family acetyltransferase